MSLTPARTETHQIGGPNTSELRESSASSGARVQSPHCSSLRADTRALHGGDTATTGRLETWHCEFLLPRRACAPMYRDNDDDDDDDDDDDGREDDGDSDGGTLTTESSSIRSGESRREPGAGATRRKINR